MQREVIVIYPAHAHNGPEQTQDKRMSVMVDAFPGENDFLVLDRVFRCMNRVDGNKIESQLEAHQERSMMVGDRIELKGKTYEVQFVGFKRVNAVAH
jgi:hypothetical protein